jgi:3,4-dihydroxy 2-butanone 4-phosphate synthase/GTP cyclohydrolase II
MQQNRRSRVEQAIAAIKNGNMVLLTDAVDREDEADFIASSKTVTMQQLNVMRKEGSGIICVALQQQLAQKLDLPLMIHAVNNKNLQGTAFTISVEAGEGITTGVSMQDRLTTIRLFAKQDVKAADFVRPGHVFPLIAHPQGLQGRQGHTEGSLALLSLVGDDSPAVICEVVDEAGQSLRGDALDDYAEKNKYTLISNEDIVWYQQNYLKEVVDYVETVLPTDFGHFYMRVYQDANQEISVLSSVPFNDLENIDDLKVRLHSSCLTGDIFASKRCDCREQLHQSLKMIQDNDGLLLYLNQEGRGIGLANKIKAYALQDQGYDTVEANIQLGLPVDRRDYSFACQLLKSLGVTQFDLITNNPCKIHACEEQALQVKKQIKITSTVHEDNEKYLLTKINKLQHAPELIG